ncbi:MAG: adenylosuccinate lyase [Gemmatimonadota bacterium]
MAHHETGYSHPLIERYASAEMADIFSPRAQALMWRDLWIGLAEEARSHGADIPASAIEAMRSARETVDLKRVAVLEAELRHDVMAHVRHFAEVAPEAGPYIHLGATSCYVTDNAGLLQLQAGLRLILSRVDAALRVLGRFAERWADLPTLGYTHWQPAQPTTVGKRATLWAQDFVFDRRDVQSNLQDLRFRGARGTTGTEASFVALFGGDSGRVDDLNRTLAERFGFSAVYPVVGQTYPRKVDHRALSCLAGIGASAARFAGDIRILQSFGEIEEPFESSQVGSSAMPYKRNPMRSERVCALSRHLCTLELDAAWTASVQGLERTLDDSANRRIAIPDAFMAADAVLQLVHNVADGLVVHEPVINARLEKSLPFLVVEQMLIVGVGKGGDRQDLHERIRRHAMDARQNLDEGAETNDFFSRVESDPAIPLDVADLVALAQPHDLVGRAPEQVRAFMSEVLSPLREAMGNDRPMVDVRV